MTNKVAYILRDWLGLVAIALGVIFNPGCTFAQKYTFTHYDIQDGLMQSQVNKLYQDKSHRLWIGTLGGACRYDGMDYFSLSKATGLINNFIYTVYTDKNDVVWFGTSHGLASYKNQKIQTYTVNNGKKPGWINQIVQDAGGTIWGVMSNRLFKVTGNHLTMVKVAGAHDTVTAIALNKQGRLLAAVHTVGVYGFNGKTWESQITFTKPYNNLGVLKILFDRQDPDRLFILTDKHVFTAKNNVLTLYNDDLLKSAMRPFLTIEQDGFNKLWIGTASGAYRIDCGKITRFDAGNGFTNVSVSDIYNDKDNNLWLGTQGDGVYRYDGDDYVIFDQTSKMKDKPIVMALAKDSKQNVLAGIDGGGVAVFNGKGLTNIWLDGTESAYRRVQALYKDHTDTIWVGTSQTGLWKYVGHRFTGVKGTEHNSVNALVEDADNLLWMSTPRGIYYYQNGSFNAIGVNVHVSALLPLSKDSLLYGTQEGVGLLINKKPVSNFKIKQLGLSTIYSMIKYKNFAIIGTDDQGVFVWDRSNGRVRNYQMKDGLKANSIYSLAADEHGLIWAGTGRGVSRFAINPKTMSCTILSSSDSKDQIIESNQNAILYNDHKMFVGTTKGLTVYNTSLPASPVSAPYVIINAIKLYGQQESKSKILTNPSQYNNLVLPYSQNHLAIAFWGVLLKSPEGISYQYRLTGLDDKFCAPVKNDVVDYPSLPPGHYTFEVKAVGSTGMVSKNIATFSFEITPPFYRTYLFQLGVILLLIFLGVALQNFVHHRKIQRQRALEAMKREEKLKIRQQTAEDFHDDLGNKLTRITVLSDILDAKLEFDKTEQRKLVMQIKQNAAALYNGTRDILWAMDPKSDNLFEVLNHIKETGIDIFEDTQIEFKFDGINEDQTTIKLPMEYSRNITMIFKELLNNVLKHADAKNVKVEFTQLEKDEAKLRIRDNGIGFDIDTLKRGHGLNNVRARAKRIGGQIDFTSQIGEGTVIELLFRINRKA